MKKNMNKGFSLVELIIVIAIMAVLVGVLAPQFIKYVESSRQSTDIDNVAEFKSAVEAYVADEMAEGHAVGDLTVNWGGATTITITGTGCTTHTISGMLQDLGIEGTKTKSDGWNTGSATYSTSTYKWTCASSVNTKKPCKDMQKAFE
ncbi:MAG: type II secretion system GspH family protein [Lachnospiraceae bacterium]|nr:type II secretion system GspH family protein [Lachnospiraceae bacterium]